MKIVIDCGNGVAGAIARQFFDTLDHDYRIIYEEVDGSFPNHHPDPCDQSTLIDLQIAVLNDGADVGLAFDGDGDRLGVVDRNGRIISSDRYMAILAREVLALNPGGTVVYDVKCGKYLENTIRDWGGVPLMWKTGHALIKAKMKEVGACFGGEYSGHIFWPEMDNKDDAFYTANRLLRIMEADPDALVNIPDFIGTPEYQVKVSNPHKFMEELCKAI